MLTPSNYINFPTVVPWATFDNAPYLQYLDLGDSVVINGLRYTTDLRRCLGAFQDRQGISCLVRSTNYATGIQAASMGTLTATQLRHIYRAKLPQYMVLNSGQRLFVRDYQEVYGSYASPMFVANGDGASLYQGVSGASTQNLGPLIAISPTSNNTYKVIGITGNGGFSAAQYDGDGIQTDTYTSTNIGLPSSSANDLMVTDVIEVSDGHVLFATYPPGAANTYAWELCSIPTFSSWYGTTTVPRVPSRAPNGPSPIRPAAVQRTVGSFYTIEMSNGTPQTTIRYVEVSNTMAIAGAQYGSITHTVCNTNVLPFNSITVPQTTIEPDMKITGKVITSGGDQYLVVVVHNVSFLNTIEADLIQNKVVTYKIDANDPSNLTLVDARDYTRSPVVLFAQNRLWMCGAHGVMVFEIANGYIFHTGTFNDVDARWLFETEDGNILAVHDRKRTAYNVTHKVRSVIHARFVETELNIADGTTQTNVITCITNGYGQLAAGMVQLTAVGCTFDDGTNVKIVTTSAIQPTTLPVTITQPGMATIVPKQL